MNQINFNGQLPPPRRNQLPVLQKLLITYRIWHEIVPNFPKTSRYTLGAKIDSLFLGCIEIIFSAATVTPNERFIKVKQAAIIIDSLKFFLQISWEIRALDTKKYVMLSEEASPVARI